MTTAPVGNPPPFEQHVVQLESAVDSKITGVSIYSDRAEVNRVVRFSVKRGQNQAIISGLPNALNHDSLRVEGKGAGTIQDVTISQDKPKAIANPPELKTSPELKKLLSNKKDLEQAIYRNDQAQTTLDKYLGSLSSQQTPSSKLSEIFSDYDAVLSDLQKKKTGLSEELEDVEKAIIEEQSKLQAAVGEQKKWNPNVSLIVTVGIFANDDGDVELGLVYAVKRTSWTARYDIRVNTQTKEKAVSLVYKASIKQSSGEDWTDVPLTLETATPSFDKTLPNLNPWTIASSPSSPSTKVTRAQTRRKTPFNPRARAPRSLPPAPKNNTNTPNSTSVLTKRRGSTGDNHNKLQPPFKQQHTEGGNGTIEGSQTDGDEYDIYDPANLSDIGGDVDMNTDSQGGDQESSFGGGSFTFTPSTPPPQDKDTEPEDKTNTKKDNDQKPATKPDGRTKKPLPPPKNSTINGHVAPASQLTPRPHKGFPRIYGASTKSLTNAITTTTKKTWNSIKGPKAFVTVAYASPTKSYSLDHVNDIKATIRKFTKNNQSLLLTPSLLVSKTNNTTPQPFLLSGLPEDETKALYDFQILSTPTLTLVIFPVRMAPDDYLMTLSGFLLEPSKENEAIVKDIVATTLEHAPTIIEWFNRHQSNLHPRLNLYPAVDIPHCVASSIEVRALTVNESSGPQIVWRIYIHPPTLDIKLTAEFTALAKDIQYASVHGYGNAKRTDFQCGLCRGRDHPTIVCPIKTVHGFFNNNPNPSLANTTQESTSSDSPKTYDDDDTLFDIPENNNHSRGHQTLRTMQATRGRGGRRSGRGLPK
ncbi:hypothetical protein EST38_g14159 [Candolleomyces aberdarensis]|uniref:DUF4139 domain-containing protein n=1 Tax=Candolleomyces aberdarensis TaxID=2316362 RepID=A0A4Q2CY09_9AGAR|nr:hypothetical protein EST38_g14159 [Candolleomyces aberdarensis]